MCHGIFLILAAAATVGCGLDGKTSNSGTTSSPGTATGTVVVRGEASGTGGGVLDDAGRLDVTLSEVTVFPAEGGSGLPAVGTIGPTTLTGGPVTVDLLALGGAGGTTLASGPTPVADYERVRVTVSQASLVLRNGTSIPLAIENGTIELPINVQVEQGQTASFTLEFNVQDSIRVDQSLQGTFRPAVRVP
jgi:hypothetical protein